MQPVPGSSIRTLSPADCKKQLKLAKQFADGFAGKLYKEVLDIENFKVRRDLCTGIVKSNAPSIGWNISTAPFRTGSLRSGSGGGAKLK